MDLQFLVFLFPAGVILCFRELRDEHVFVIIYALVGTYFAGVMVRLMLTLTPCVCVAAAVALSTVLDTYIDPRAPETPENPTTAPTTGSASSEGTPKKPRKDKAPAAETAKNDPIEDVVSGLGVFTTLLEKDKSPRIAALDSRFAVVSVAVFLLVFFVQHCTWVTSYAYSSPSVVLASRNQDGSQHIIDDFREAYYWLRQNTREDAVVMSWWDYGYQIAGMADRPTLVDNNTWNNSQCGARVVRSTVTNSHNLQLTSPPSGKPCPPPRKSLIPSSANTTLNTFSSSSEG
jgi:dolichyl-diphosphooligosaccharide--protein glycosyltransferase